MVWAAFIARATVYRQAGGTRNRAVAYRPTDPSTAHFGNLGQLGACDNVERSSLSILCHELPTHG